MNLTEQAIADLDASLASDGEWIELQRLTGTQQIPVKVKVRAFVRSYRAEELIGGITQTRSIAPVGRGPTVQRRRRRRIAGCRGRMIGL